MSLIWNNRITVSYFGEPQDSVTGINIDNLPTGEYIDSELLKRFIDRLFPKSMGNKKRIPSPRIVSGIKNEHTTGSPLCAIIQNPDIVQEKKSGTPSNFRYGHADYTGTVRYRGFEDAQKYTAYSEHFLIPLCFAGALAGQILERRGIYTSAHIASVHNIKDNPYDPVNITRDALLSIRCKDFPVINDRKGWLMLEDIVKARDAGESLGGVIECATVNIPSGVGSPVFNGLKNNIAQLVFSIPGISGLEFGSGFSSAGMAGSQSNDKFYTNEQGYTLTRTNNHGGIIGGVSSGMPIRFNTALNPVTNNDSGLFKTCFVPSAVPCIESAVNIALLSNMIDYPNFCLR